MPSSQNNRKVQKKKAPVKKQWKAAPSKRSAISAKKSKANSTKVLELLKRYYPNAHCALNYENPYELLVATVLSAQCTDERVNKVTPELFKQFPDPEKMAKAPVQKIEELIRSTGFFSTKAKNLKAAAEILVKKYAGQIPKELDQLVELPGVGRKTANVVLGNAFNITSGIVVDTHVTRLSNRLGWTKSQNAVLIEKDLTKFIPLEDWILISHLLISHGRAVCKARSPKCSTCFLESDCPKIGVEF